MDVSSAATLIIAIVPFDQIPVDFSDSSKASQLTGAPGTLQRAGKHLGKTQSAQPFLEPARIALATFCERQVSKSRVLTRESPSGFPVSGQVNDRKHLVHGSPDLARPLRHIIRNSRDLLGVLDEEQVVITKVLPSFMCQWKFFVLKQRLPLLPPWKRGIKDNSIFPYHSHVTISLIFRRLGFSLVPQFRATGATSRASSADSRNAFE